MGGLGFSLGFRLPFCEPFSQTSDGICSRSVARAWGFATSTIALYEGWNNGSDAADGHDDKHENEDDDGAADDGAGTPAMLTVTSQSWYAHPLKFMCLPNPRLGLNVLKALPSPLCRFPPFEAGFKMYKSRPRRTG